MERHATLNNTFGIGYLMNRNNAIGMFMGLYIGDALGGPLEFTSPNTGSPVTEMIGGGVHDLSVGEYTDDGAMSSCITNAYLNYKRFAPSAITQNFKQWRNRGAFGTRDRCFDIGTVTSEALVASSNKRPYGGASSYMTDGNGGIMRMAPHILFNHNNRTMAIAEAVAGSIITHGTGSCVAYTAMLAAELYDGAEKADQSLYGKGIDKPDGSVMGCYASAWHSISHTNSFEDAVVHAVNKGGDADTVGAVTGMIAGRLYGYDAIPQRWLDNLFNCDELMSDADKLYDMGSKENT